MPADLATLSALKARVEAATGPDRELDAEIWWAFADHSETDGDIRANAEELGAMAALDRWCGPLWRRTSDMVPFLTDSMDAAHALLQRELPGWEIDIHISGGGTAGADVRGPEFSDADMSQYAQGKFMKNTPLAILSALLTAKIAQLETFNVV